MIAVAVQETQESAIASELGIIEEKARARGALMRPEDVVEYARDPETALHERFTWDDTVAAIRWRIQEARVIIHSVRVVVESKDKPGTYKTVQVQKYLHLRTDNKSGGGYRQALHIMSDADLRKRMLVEAMADQRAWKNRYGHLCELAGVVAAIEEAEAAINKN